MHAYFQTLGIAESEKMPRVKLDAALKWAVSLLLLREELIHENLSSAVQDICRQSTDRVGWCLAGPASCVNREQVATEPEEKDHARQNISVFGVYPAYPNVERGVKVLRTAGFRDSDISVFYPEKTDSKDLAQEKSNKVQDAATAGGGTGALVGGALGSLVGLASLTIAGVGPFMVAGPMLGALAGPGFGGVLGEIAGALLGLGMSEGEARLYEERAKSGLVLISVHTDSLELTQRAQEVLLQTGARDISSIAEMSSAQRSDSALRQIA